MTVRLLAPLLTIQLIACGDGTGGPDTGVDVDCPTHDAPSFELGTGQLEYQPITDGQALSISPGAQGGCHFFVAVRTDGFAERRFQVQYEVFYEDNSSTSSRSSFTVRLHPAEGMPGKCENVGITAFLIQPWNLEDDRLILEVNVEDDLGRTASQRKTVIADWPADLPEDGCGPRT